MNIAILGAGALGSFFSAKLSQKHHVLLIGRDEEKIKRIQKNGITVTGISRFKANKKNLTVVTDTRKISPVDLLLVLVKAHQTEEAVKQHGHLMGKNTVVLTLQNGLGNVEAIRKAAGGRQKAEGEKCSRLIMGTTGHGVTLLAPGAVRHAGRGETVIGGSGQGAGNEVAEVLSSCGIVTKVTNNIEGAVWGKLALNCAINPVAALLHIKNGVIPKNPHSFFLAKSALLEAVSVTRKKRLVLPYKDSVNRLREVCEATDGNINSMLQDVMNKKMTEIDTINGAVVREAKRMKVHAPVNAALVLLVKALERAY